MKKLPLATVALAALQASALFGQTFTGTWQGALKIPQAPNGELRVVFKISTTEADQLAAQMFSIDQGGQPIPAKTVTASGSSLKIDLPALGGTYEGRMSGDGTTINGTWTQGQPLPLNLIRTTPQTAWTIPEPLPPPKMIDPNAKVEFEVATVKPSDPNKPGWGINVNRSGMFTTHNTTLADLIKFAFDLHPKQVIGAPAWYDTEKFDLTGKPNQPGIPSVKQMQAMLQKLLADRFELTFHKEKKELSAYSITVAKDGAKISKEETNPTPVPGFGGRPQGGFHVNNATMAEFASVMQAQFMDEPVVDQTGLGDTRYTFVLKFTPDAGMQPFGGASAPPQEQTATPNPDAPPDIYSAMARLGLRMQKTKAPVDVMVIETVRKPSAN